MPPRALIAASASRPRDLQGPGMRLGVFVTFRARAGLGEALAARLLRALDEIGEIPICELCIVSRVPDDADLVHVTEIWTSAAAHEEFARRPDVRELITEIHSMCDEPPEVSYVRPAGGIGLPRVRVMEN